MQLTAVVPARWFVAHRGLAVGVLGSAIATGTLVFMPLAAWVDGKGRPFVLTEFRQGLPLLDCVATGRLSASGAHDALTGLAETIRAAHARGLSHGSIVPGNVLWRPNGSIFVLDFGLAPCLALAEPPIAWPQSDLAGFASLEHSLVQLGRGPAPQSAL